jgi:hypothetical protein
VRSRGNRSRRDRANFIHGPVETVWIRPDFVELEHLHVAIVDQRRRPSEAVTDQLRIWGYCANRPFGRRLAIWASPAAQESAGQSAQSDSHEGAVEFWSLGLDLNGIALDPDLKCTDRLPGGPAADSARGHIKLAPVARTSHDRPLQLSFS